MARPERAITSSGAMEGAIREWLVEAQSQRPLIFERIPDSKMAGNLIQEAPADFYLVFGGRFSYLEAKFSAKHASLRACFSNAVSGGQLASAHLARRAGARYFLLFYSSVARVFELWDGAYGFERRRVHKPLEPAHLEASTTTLDPILRRVLELTWNIHR